MSTGGGRLLHLGWLATSLITAAALVATAWSSHRTARRATDTLERGQGQAFLSALQQLIRQGGTRLEELDLTTFLTECADKGLRRVSLHRPEGQVLVEAGTSTLGPLPLASLATDDVVIERRVGRIRLLTLTSLPSRRGPREADDWGGRDGRPDDGWPPPPSDGAPPPDFEPRDGEPRPPHEIERDGRPRDFDRDGRGRGPRRNDDGRPDRRPRRRPNDDGARDREPPSGGPPGMRERGTLGDVEPSAQVSNRRRRGGSGGGRRGMGRGGMRRGPGASPFIVALEYEPLVSAGLVADSRRSLGLSAAAAVVLTAAALLFWQLLRQRERQAAELAEQRRLSGLGEMSAVLAHELRNPLASLKGHAQLLAERLGGDEKQKAKADRVVSEATRLELLCRDLLEFTRSGPIDRRPGDPVQTLRDAVSAVDASRIVVDVGGAPTSWPLDAARVRQVLTNLLRNALQASPDGESVTTSIRRDGRDLVMSVRDRGPGLPAGQEEQVFQPFFTTKTTGTGLGLPVARRIAEMHGGRLEAENLSGGGAQFRLVLPKD
ncbi:MAG: HAMP domain-containing sensor histidine kinase [Acidobacteriota bacterium]